MSVPVFPVSFYDGYGCGGDEPRCYALAAAPSTRAELFAAAKRLPVPGDRDEVAAALGLPPAPRRPLWGPSWGSRGAFLDAQAASVEERAAWEAALDAAALRLPALWRDAGLRLCVPSTGWWFDADSAPPALEVVSDHGCRCSYGHRSKPDPLERPVEAFLTEVGGRAFLSTRPFTEAEAFDALAAAALVADERLASYRLELEEVEAFEVLSLEDERLLSPAEWDVYEQERKDVDRRRYRLRDTLQERREGVLVAALAAAGLFSLTLDAFPGGEDDD